MISGVVLPSSIQVARDHGAVTEARPYGYAAACPALPGIGTTGGSEEEALSELGDLIRLHEARLARRARGAAS